LCGVVQRGNPDREDTVMCIDETKRQAALDRAVVA